MMNEDIDEIESMDTLEEVQFEDQEPSLDLYHLPVEVWMMILGYVDPYDLPAVAMVNTKFADLVNEPSIWTKLRVSARKLIQNPKLYVEKICWYTWLGHLEIIGDLHKNVGVPTEEAENITEHKEETSSIHYTELDKVPEKLFRNVAASCPRLKVLKVFNCVLDQSYINQLSEGCPMLRVMNLEHCDLVGVGLSLKRFKNLRVFNMVECTYQRATN
eukprot:TRINITY_DN2328_c0_g1_i8.p1 TRINITY_DN2328_c0_g1~~TRINITY_DN2328_c0_g1_i8.p1  ORF type:complete len:216 (+),score=50.72 TRINITY_DN2328_c0_g1_i8:310-957(+)